MDFDETPDLEFTEPIAPESDANVCEETPNLVFTEEVDVAAVAAATAAAEEYEIDDLDEPDQYVESAHDEADEQNVNDNGTGLHHTLCSPIPRPNF